MIPGKRKGKGFALELTAQEQHTQIQRNSSVLQGFLTVFRSRTFFLIIPYIKHMIEWRTEKKTATMGKDKYYQGLKFQERQKFLSTPQL